MAVRRLYVETPLAAGAELSLPERAVRHAQVLRLKPGDALTLFDGRGGESDAELLHLGRRAARVRVGRWHDVDRELAARVTLAVGMPANERMDGLVEKASELGAAVIQPLECERSVLRLAAERAARRRLHWQGIAIAAAEQCGRTRIASVEPVRRHAEWLSMLAALAPGEARITLAARDGSTMSDALRARGLAHVIVLSGPEGGFTAGETVGARAAAFRPATLGPRVLRADTAPLAALAQLMTLLA